MDPPRYDHNMDLMRQFMTAQPNEMTSSAPSVSQPTLTQLVKLGMSTDDTDYLLDPLYCRYQDITWSDSSSKEFLESNDMSLIQNDLLSIPPESLNYMTEDDNSYMKLENGLYNLCQTSCMDVMETQTNHINSSPCCPTIAPQPSPASSGTAHLPPLEIDITSGGTRVYSSANHHPQSHADHRLSFLMGLTLGEELHSTLHHYPGIINYTQYQPTCRAVLSHPRPLGNGMMNMDIPKTTNDINIHMGLKRKYEKRTTKEEQIQNGNNLWQFLMRLLVREKNVIEWTGHDLEFRIVNKEEVARLWGSIKNRQKMNFDKFSRALRYYYNKRILIHNPQCRLTYCFMRNPTDPVFSTMLQDAMRTLPDPTVCSAYCDNNNHPHELQYAKRKMRHKHPRSVLY